MIHMPHWPEPLGSKRKDFFLDRIKSFLNTLGNPKKQMPPIIHIAGTNGKGSTLAFIRYIMQVNFNERIIIARSYIDDNELCSLLEECPSLAFSCHKADITLVEAGMGGKPDATNVRDSPILTIITTIALDQTEYLGPTIEIIAGEKTGIMKPNVPCVMAPQEKSVMNTLEHHAIIKKSPLYRGAIQSIEFSLPSLKGDHQVINAGNAIAACSILSGKYGFHIGEEDITSGLQRTYWPALLELIKEGNLISLLSKDWQLFLDGAQDNDGARVVSQWVKDNFAEGIYVIFGVTRNRNVEESLEHLKPYIKLLCAVCVKSKPKATDTNLIRGKANNVGIKAVECESISDAISSHILKASIRNTTTILICGSLFLARDFAMEILYEVTKIVITALSLTYPSGVIQVADYLDSDWILNWRI
ncbi:dihydrofolate synthase/folylpolyglutamate synthase-like [Calliopsis andreniformis]|uniref:dihydrofolate synthase/folylpolyglutamate synthase-like n=1 Tax=Calliopsis andreniformis TaxID=337506 RepID=UPI003FCCE4DB